MFLVQRECLSILPERETSIVCFFGSHGHFRDWLKAPLNAQKIIGNPLFEGSCISEGHEQTGGGRASIGKPEFRHLRSIEVLVWFLQTHLKKFNAQCPNLKFEFSGNILIKHQDSTDLFRSLQKSNESLAVWLVPNIREIHEFPTGLPANSNCNH